MPPKVTVSVPRSLRTTASERAKLKSAFKSKITSIVKPHGAGRSADNDITNVGGGGVVAQVIVVNDTAAKRAAKGKAGKKK